MIQFYYKLVDKRKLTIEEVPEKYREQVKLLLEKND